VVVNRVLMKVVVRVEVSGVLMKVAVKVVASRMQMLNPLQWMMMRKVVKHLSREGKQC